MMMTMTTMMMMMMMMRMIMMPCSFKQITRPLLGFIMLSYLYDKRLGISSQGR